MVTLDYLDFTCPNCGVATTIRAGVLSFDCSGCGRQLVIVNGLRGLLIYAKDPASGWPEYFHFQTFECPNCGAGNRTPADTSSSTCSDCGEQLVVANGMVGVYTKEQANEAPKYFKGETRTCNSGECNCNE